MYMDITLIMLYNAMVCRFTTFGLFWTTNPTGRKASHTWSLRMLIRCLWRWDSVGRGCSEFRSLSSRLMPNVTVLQVLQQRQWRHQLTLDQWDCMLDHCITTSTRRCCVVSLSRLERQVLHFISTHFISLKRCHWFFNTEQCFCKMLNWIYLHRIVCEFC